MKAHYPKSVQTYLSPDQRSKLDQMARDRGLTIASLLRRMVIDYTTRFEMEKVQRGMDK